MNQSISEVVKIAKQNRRVTKPRPSTHLRRTPPRNPPRCG